MNYIFFNCAIYACFINFQFVVLTKNIQCIQKYKSPKEQIEGITL